MTGLNNKMNGNVTSNDYRLVSFKQLSEGKEARYALRSNIRFRQIVK